MTTLTISSDNYYNPSITTLRKNEYSFSSITSGNTLCCAWCGKSLGEATQVTYLNGNQPVCDLCLIKAGEKKVCP